MSRQNNKCKEQEENNMCRKLVVTNEIFLGARPICYTYGSTYKIEMISSDKYTYEKANTQEQ